MCTGVYRYVERHGGFRPTTQVRGTYTGSGRRNDVCDVYTPLYYVPQTRLKILGQRTRGGDYVVVQSLSVTRKEESHFYRSTCRDVRQKSVTRRCTGSTHFTL